MSGNIKIKYSCCVKIANMHFLEQSTTTSFSGNIIRHSLEVLLQVAPSSVLSFYLYTFDIALFAELRSIFVPKIIEFYACLKLLQAKT